MSNVIVMDGSSDKKHPPTLKFICTVKPQWSNTKCDIRIDLDTNEYPNIFVSRKRYERISEYIRIKRNDTNMIRMNIRIENDTNI